MKEEILGGLKNAMDRGDSLEKAAKSFINAGYNPSEVKEAITIISPNEASLLNLDEFSGALTKDKPASDKKESSPSQIIPSAVSQTLAPQSSAVQSSSQPSSNSPPASAAQPIQKIQPLSSVSANTFVSEKKQGSKRTVIILLIIFLILVLGLIVTLMYGDAIISMLK